MKRQKLRYKNLLDSLIPSWIIWVFAALLFGMFRAWGNEDLPDLIRISPFKPLLFLVEMVIFGTAMGVPFGILDFALANEKINRLPYWKIILIKSTLQVVLAFFSIVVLIIINNELRHLNLGVVNFVFSPSTYLWIIYSGIISFCIYFFQVVKSKFGNKMMVNLILGRYHFPRVESRIFMFLDMRGSTTHAENLGHIQFSSLIQHCFRDLTMAIIRHDVEIYQYIGDEAVLTWKIDDGLRNSNCIKVYFHFMDILEKKRKYYEQQFGLMPYFKAGVHIGDVTVSEVGVIKREIAYHSDVLNTAARIQGKCNEFNADLLVSEKLKNKLNDANDFTFDNIGGLTLKGKHQPVSIYKVVSYNRSKKE